MSSRRYFWLAAAFFVVNVVLINLSSPTLLALGALALLFAVGCLAAGVVERRGERRRGAQVADVTRLDGEPGVYAGTRLALELIQTATSDDERIRELAEGQRPQPDDIIEAAHRRLAMEVEKIAQQRASASEVSDINGR